MLTQSQLKEHIHYCPDTGAFTRISSPRKWRIGIIKNCANDGIGYFTINLLGKRYKAHRLAWLYIHGSFPVSDTDHINGNRIDNRLCNLREASRTENQQNRGEQINNTSGFKGVSFHKQTGKWRAQISIAGKVKHLGRYLTPESASEAYHAAAKTIHAEFYYMMFA